MQVYKYPINIVDSLLSPSGSIEVEMPASAKITMVGFQGQVVCIWALVDKDMHIQTRRFALLPTGGSAPSNATHVSTFMAPDGFHVFHLFELGGGS